VPATTAIIALKTTNKITSDIQNDFSSLLAFFQFSGIYIYRDFPHCKTLIIDKTASILVDKGGKESFAF
jgi:hypothetical protein